MMKNNEIVDAPIRLQEAVDFINEVKLRFYDKRDQYQLDQILIYKIVTCILKDLINKFPRFLLMLNQYQYLIIIASFEFEGATLAIITLLNMMLPTIQFTIFLRQSQHLQASLHCRIIIIIIICRPMN